MTDVSEGIDLDGLRALAEAATPGPWEAHIERYGNEVGDYFGGFIPGVAEPIATEWNGEQPPFDPDDATYIAAADPQTVLALIARAESAERRIEKAEDFITRHYLDTDMGRDVLAALTEGDEQ